MHEQHAGDCRNATLTPETGSQNITAQTILSEGVLSGPVLPEPVSVSVLPRFREYDESITAPNKKSPSLPRLPPAVISADANPARPQLHKLDFLTKPLSAAPCPRFTVISTFAGCGGSSLGYKWAGGQVLAAIEWEKDSAATYRRNHVGTPVLEKDIAAVTADELLTLADLKVGELDVLDGSPPCQGFSVAGARHFDDPRNQLFREYVRLLKELRPRTMIMENVSGMVKGDHKQIFAEALSALKGAGYTVRVWLLDAQYFGVPQSRQRLIFIGVRNDLAEKLNLTPSCPVPLTEPISFGEACGDLRGNGPDERFLCDIIRKVGAAQPSKWSTDEAIYLKVKGNLASSMSLQWALWGRVCGTIVKSEFGLSGIVHPDRERYISLAEARRCASFPEAFQFTNRKKGIERIGNSVPPRFMQAIAETVYGTLLKPVHNAADRLEAFYAS